MNIGQTIRKLRTERGWGQVELSERTGRIVSQAAIAQLEGGKKQNMKLETLAALARAFGIPAVDLLPEEFHRPPSQAA
jgi:transcriptional regulator with XRE-family HTH domain